MKRLVLAIVLLSFMAFPAFAADKEKETVYERVMRTNTLRCGYWNWAPLFNVNVKTGEFSGIFYELTEYMAASLGLKVEWTKEVGFATFEQDLISKKVDAICAGVWPKAARARAMEFSDSVFYVPLHVYVRRDDMRFDNNPTALNSPDITFSGMDGLAEGAIVAQDFPMAKRVSVPDVASVSEIFLMVQQGKADAVIADIFTAGSFLKNNPDVLRLVKTDRPTRYFANTIATNKGEQELINLLNISLEEAQSAGVIDDLLAKYEDVPNSLLRIAKPYEVIK